MEKIIINKKFRVLYGYSSIKIFDNEKDIFIKEFKNLKTEAVITDIIFNPIVDNIILISLSNGSCKIYNILEEEMEEKIVLEEFKEVIIASKFNILNTNIIGSLFETKILVWDIRNIKYINIFENKEEILNFKWNDFSENLLEITTKKEVKLIDIKTLKIEKVVKKKNEIQNILFLKDEIIIIIGKDSIIKINRANTKYISLNNIKEYNDKFIRDEILIIFFHLLTNINFIDIDKMEVIINVDFGLIKYCTFINSNKDNEVLIYYFNEEKKLNIQEFQIKNKVLKNSINSDNTNLKDNFYEKYQKKIYRYTNLLKYEENIFEDFKRNKKYMEIEEIERYFNEIKKIDIFTRKDFINNIFEEKNKEIKFNDILNINNFSEIRSLIKNGKMKEIEEKGEIEKIRNILKKTIDNIIKNNKDNIINFYIKIIKLLILDNSNKMLIEIYLIFLKEYETILIEHFSEEKIEIYNKERKYYYPCFSKEEYKILFDLDKESEKNIIITFLNEANNLKNFDYNNGDLKNLVNKAKELMLDLPDFNQPIELDCSNEELKWHKIKINILSKFKDFKLIKDEQNILGGLRNGIKKIISKGLLTNINIFNNKDKLECTILLITNPCNIYGKDFDFCSNLFLSKEKLTENELNDFINNNKDKYAINLKKNNNKYYLENNNKDIFYNPEYLCLNNFFINNLEKEEKYNFDYLINNFVPNQKKIREFLKKILQKNVFIELNKILFGDDNDYKLLNNRYLTEFIDNRLKFAPIRPFGCAAASDKLSLNTYICAKKRKIFFNLNGEEGDLEDKEVEEILNTGNYVLIEEHEIFHLLDSIPYYENNCSLSIETPRKKNYDGETEGGKYLELLLFNKVIESINLAEVLYILNERNYDKTLTDFKLGFEKLDKKDLEIIGIFSSYNNAIDLNKNEVDDLKNKYIKIKSISRASIPNIKIRLNNDLIPCGKRPNRNYKYN